MFRNRKHGIAILPFIAAIAGVGCQGGEDTETFGGIVEAPERAAGVEPARADSADEARAIVAELHVGERSTVRFVDESVSVPGGGVGVLMIGAPRLFADYKELGLTPLELYMALAPERDIPELLRQDHRAAVAARGLAAIDPRQVSFEAGELALGGQPSRVRRQDPGAQSTSVTDCTSYVGDTPVYWADTWCSATAPGSAWCDTEYGLTGNKVAYTGAAGERWLAACNDSNSSNATLSWGVQLEFVAGVWSAVSGTSITLAKDRAVNYHSSGIQVQNYRAVITAGSTVVYQVGAARD